MNVFYTRQSLYSDKVYAVSVVIKGFIPKTRAWEGADHLLPQLVALVL